MLFSIVIPAHNEEKYIGKCIKAIRVAERFAGTKAQIIVVANRCTDKTEMIARKLGVTVCKNNDKCISAVRNAGAKMASGKILVTIDADSCMSKTSLKEIRDRCGSFSPSPFVFIL